MQSIELSLNVLDSASPHQMTRLCRQDERFFTDVLRDILSDQRLAVLTICTMEWCRNTVDAIIETMIK